MAGVGNSLGARLPHFLHLFPALQSRNPISSPSEQGPRVSLRTEPGEGSCSRSQLAKADCSAAPYQLVISSKHGVSNAAKEAQLGLGILHLSLESCRRCSSQVTLAEVQRAGRLPRHLGGDAGLGQRARGTSSELRPPPRSKAAKLTTAAALLHFPLDTRRVKSHLSKEQQGKSFAQGRKKNKIPFTQQLLPQLCKERGQGWCQRQ